MSRSGRYFVDNRTPIRYPLSRTEYIYSQSENEVGDRTLTDLYHEGMVYKSSSTIRSEKSRANNVIIIIILIIIMSMIIKYFM